MKAGKYLIVDVGGLFGVRTYTVKSLSDARKKLDPEGRLRDWKIFRANADGNIEEIGLNGQAR
jgi:hypothetical protein